MLAATIALSPVVTYGVVGSPVQVEAAVTTSSTVGDATTRLVTIYSQLEKLPGAEGAFKTASEKLSNWTEGEWEALLPTGNKINDSLPDNTSGGSQLSAGILAKEMALITFSADRNTLQTNMTNFINKYDDALETALEVDNPTETILEFLVAAEKQLWENEDALTAITEGESIYDLVLIIKTELIKDPEFKALNDALREKMNFGIEGLFLTKDNINNKLIVDLGDGGRDIVNKINLSLALAALSSLPTPPSFPLPTPGEEQQPGKDEVAIPEDAVVTEGGTTTIPADKVGAIADLVTAEKSVVPVKLPTPAAGEKAKAEVPAALFSEVVKKNAKAVVEVKTEEASYKLPASQINVASLAEKLGVSASDVKINVSVNVVKNEDVKGTVDKNNLKLASKVIEFTIEAVAGDKTEAVKTFSVYVERDIVADTAFDASKSVAVVLNDDGTFKAIPTLFNGKTATIKSLTNSKYTVVENEVTFPDITKDWAKEYIETLASKYIIKGHDTGKYAPNGSTTRAEFALLLVRSLGLPGEKYDNRFSDVKGTEWFNENGELMAAVKAGIIEGRDTGKFDPHTAITRAEAAAMIARAIELDFLNYDKSTVDTSKKLKDFKDANKVPTWAKEELEAVVQAGIMSGHDNGTIDANGDTTRNQIAKIVAEFLIKANLMNDTINK